jgi:hypothetical protein
MEMPVYSLASRLHGKSNICTEREQEGKKVAKRKCESIRRYQQSWIRQQQPPREEKLEPS